MSRKPPPPSDRPSGSRLRRTEATARNRKKLDPTVPLAFLVLGLLVAQCMRVAFASPKLRLEQVRVTGTKRLTDQKVMDLTGIRLNQNVFHIDLHATAARLKKEPVIRTAAVTRLLPNTLLVELGERLPSLQVKVDSELWLVDKEGVVYEQARGLTQALPVLEACRQDVPMAGEKIRKELLETVATCHAEAKKRKLGLLRMRVDAARELWLHVAAPAQAPIPAADSTAPSPGQMLVRIGRATDIAAKLDDVQQALLAWTEWGSQAKYLDVMCAGQPAYKELDDADQPTKTARAQ